MSAQQDQVFFQCQFLCLRLRKYAALRGEINRARLVTDPFYDRPPRIVHRLRLHDHSRATAVRVIVYFFMFVQCVVADIDAVDCHEPFVRGPTDNACI